MIKARTINLYLSQETIDLITPTPTLAVAIHRHLKAIISQLNPNESLPNNPNILEKSTSIIIDADSYRLLTIAALSNPSLTISAAVDGLLHQHLSSLVPTISIDTLIVGTNQISLEFGTLVRKAIRPNDKYWYWRYYDADGKRKDKYMSKNLDNALARVREIGYPDDAVPKRKGKSKKVYELNCG